MSAPHLARAAGLAALAALACQAAPPRPDAGAPSAPAPWRPTRPPPPLAAAPAPWPAAREGLLPSGLRVVVVEHHRRPVVAVHLVLPRGALSDPPDGAGLGRLSVALAGDLHERSPEGEELHWEKTFRRQVVELGAIPALQLGSEVTRLAISGYAGDAGAYLRLLAGAVQAPRHGAEAFRVRRNQQLDALEDLETGDPEVLDQLLAEAAFGAGHPYARSVAGTLATVGALGLEDVVAHQARLFAPRGATLLVVGDVAADKVLADARAAFGRWRGDPLPPPSLEAGAAARRVEPGHLRREPASTLLACATRLVPDGADDATLDVLAAVIGQGSGSRLMAALREERGLTYGASAQVVRRQRARAFLACSALRADEAVEGLRAFRQVLEAARLAPPGDPELERARALRLAEVEAAGDDVEQLSAAWVEALALGRPAPRLAEERAALERVSAADVQRLGRTVFDPAAVRWILSGDTRVAARAAEAAGLGRPRALGPVR